MNNIQRQKEHFESIAEKYFKARQNENYIYIRNLMWEYFFKNSGFKASSNILVLEPMCGYADGKKILEEHLNIPFTYEGFDYSENIVNYLQENFPDVNISHMDVRELNVNEKYDLVIVIGAIHHVYEYTQTVINNIYNSLKYDGYFINFEPTHNNLLFQKIRNQIYKKNFLFDEETEKAFELEEINKYYKKSGFNINYQFYPGLLSYVLYYNPDAFPFLNIGNKSLVKMIFNIDKLFFNNIIGKKLSFVTFTLLHKTQKNI